ncbi:MAG: peptidylprolyl isomerase [Paracoccaceae bacterium]
MNFLSRSLRPVAALLAGALFAALFTTGAAAQTAFAPVVVVNDDVITYYDVEQRARLLQMSGANAGPALTNAAMEQLIDDRLRAQAGKRFNLAADATELDAAVDEFAGRLGTDRAAIEKRIAGAGVDRAALDNFLSSQIVWRELVNGRFGGRATPTEVELDQEIALAASGQTRTFRLSEIAIPSGRGQGESARAEAQRIMNEIQRGGDFAALARRFSRAPSAKNGGDVGWVPETVLPPELAQAIANTAPGGVTPPLEVPGGIAIYRVADTRSEAPPWARDAEMSLQRVRVSIDGSDEAATAEAVSKAESLREEIEGCGPSPNLSAEAVVEPIDEKLVSALPGPVRDAVRLLQPGQTSRPVAGDGGVDIFVVCSRTGGVDDATRTQLRDQIRTQRLTRLSEGFLQELRREAVIERR